MTFHSPLSPTEAPTQGPIKAPTKTLRSPSALTPILVSLLGILGLCLAPLSASAIESPFEAEDARAADQATAEEFAAYPAPARRAALIAAGYPESLLEIQRLQQNSADRFAALVDNYPREVQAQVWDLVRYPGLAADLARGGKKSDTQLDDIADRYPSADHFAIIEEGKERYDLWVQIYALDLESQQNLSTILASEPVEVQAAFEEITTRPDLMSLLAENIQWTTFQGAAYLENPARVDAQFETLAAQVLARRQNAESEWADEVSDPEAAKELETAAREFADEYGYDYDDELRASAPQRATSNTTIIVQNAHPYPYFFGYPSWYASAFWYPLSFSSHIGFGYRYGYGRGLGFGFASYGLPSPFFLGWYHDVYRPRFARNDFGVRNFGRSIRYYENNRPFRSVNQRRHIRNRNLAKSSRGSVRIQRRQDRAFEQRRDRRGHAGAIADRALRNRGGSDRNLRSRSRDGVRQQRGVTRNDRQRPVQRNRINNQRGTLGNGGFLDNQRGTRGNRDLRNNQRGTRGNRSLRNNQRGTRGSRDLRSDRGQRNPAVRAGGQNAQRVARRQNDGVRNAPVLRQARANLARATNQVGPSTRRAPRADRNSARRFARVDRKATRNQARASSGGGGKQRAKAARTSSRSQRVAKSNRSGGSRKAQRQNRSKRSNRGKRNN